MFAFLLANLAAGLWVLFIAFGLGFPIAVRFAPRATNAIQLSLAFLLGATLLAYALMAAGLLGWLTPLPLLSILAILSIPLVVYGRRIWHRLLDLSTSLRSAFLQATPIDRAVLI